MAFYRCGSGESFKVGGDVVNTDFKYIVPPNLFFNSFTEFAMARKFTGDTYSWSNANGVISSGDVQGMNITWVYDLAQIGMSQNGTTNIKGAKKIKYKIKTGDSYGHIHSNDQDRWGLIIGVAPQSYTSKLDYIPSAGIYNRYSNVDYTLRLDNPIEGELDLSEMTGDIYPYIMAHGWQCEFEEFIVEF